MKKKIRTLQLLVGTMFVIGVYSINLLTNIAEDTDPSKSREYHQIDFRGTSSSTSISIEKISFSASVRRTSKGIAKAQ